MARRHKEDLPGPRTTRPYRSQLRTEQARETRRRILDAAEALFLDQGYVRSTVAAIAGEAGVSAETVYATFGNKKALLQTLVDVRIAGDDEPVPLLERPGPEAVVAEADQRRRVTMFAAGIRRIIERVRRLDDLMVTAAAADEEIAALRADLQLRQRRKGMDFALEALAGEDGLRIGRTREQASAVLWTLTSPEVHRLLCDQRGFSGEEYEAWLGDAIARLLLPLPPDP